MTGKTHLSVGTAAAVCVTQPQTLSSLLLCLGTAAIGSVISDIDVTTSDSREQLNKISILTLLVIAALLFAEWKWNVGIRYRFQKESSIYRLAVSFLLFLGVCTFGKNQPAQVLHAFSARTGDPKRYCVWNFPGPYPLFFFVAMLSHHARFDMLNYKMCVFYTHLNSASAWTMCHA